MECLEQDSTTNYCQLLGPNSEAASIEGRIQRLFILSWALKDTTDESFAALAYPSVHCAPVTPGFF